MRASVPANLLILGEYAVTEEGGLGLALACAPRVQVEAEPLESGGLRIEGRMGGSAFTWVESEAEPLAMPLLGALARGGRTRPGRDVPGLLARVDSSAFFGPDGAKLGFGSSAAVAVALAAVLLRARGLEGEALEAAIFPLALEAHRAAQGGRGSGYDVAASRFGGVGVFRGGRVPEWRPIPDSSLARSALPRLFLIGGSGPVSSSAAVARYRSLADADPAWAKAFLASSNKLVRDYLDAEDLAARLEVLGRASVAGLALGERIGVSARMATPEAEGFSERTAVVKALGAGNELGVVAVSGEDAAQACLRAGLREVQVAMRGLSWE